MFRKLVTNLPFSPSLAGQVSFYSKRLKQEEFVRRFGLLFVALAMTAQSFMAISPPEAAIAVGPNNIIYSGISSKEDLLQKYRDGTDGNGHDDIKQIFDYYKINENSIKNAKETTVSRNDRGGNLRSIGRYKQGFASEITVKIPGSSTTVYERDLAEWNGGPYHALEGTRTDGTYFAVLMSCGNIVIDENDEPERPPTHTLALTCDSITGKVEDPDGDEVPVRTWIRVANEQKTTGEWIDITDKLPFIIPNTLKSYENPTVASVEIKDVNTGEWLPAITGQEVGPCLDPPPPPPPPPEPKPEPEPYVACTSLRWVDTQNVTKITLEAKATVEHAVINAFKFVVNDSDSNIVASKSVETSETSATYSVDLEEFGTYQASAFVVTKEGEITSGRCNETISIENPITPVFEVIKNKEASNITQEIDDANNTKAKPGDVIEYRLFTRNTGNIAGETEIKENMADVLEYAILLESDGAEVHEGTGVLDWGKVEIQPNETVTKTITVKINEAVTDTPRSAGDPASYDLILRNVYGEDVINITVPCSQTGKCIEEVVTSLPNTGPGVSAFVNTILIISSVYFYLRTRQVGKELDLIKAEYNYSV